jgi:hypothetical protein
MEKRDEQVEMKIAALLVGLARVSASGEVRHLAPGWWAL